MRSDAMFVPWSSYDVWYFQLETCLLMCCHQFVDGVQVSTHRRSWHDLRRSWSLQAGFKRTASQENTSSCLQRCVLTVCFGAMYPRAIRQVLTAAKTQRTFFCFELPMPIAESHASCFHWFDGRGIIHRFNSVWSWFWTISRPPKSTTGFFGTHLFRSCVLQNTDLAALCLRKSGQIFAAHIRAQHQISRIAPQELVTSLAQSISMA